MRVTKAMLDTKVDAINEKLGFEADKVQYNTIGAYTLSGAYGGWQLQKIVTDGGGVRSITSGYDTKKDLYYQLVAFLNGMEA